MGDRPAVKKAITRRLAAAIEAAAKPYGGVLMTLADVLRERKYKIRQQDLSAWSKGRVPDLDRIPEIAEALGVSWQWLLVGEVEKISPRPPEPSSAAPQHAKR